MPSTTGTILLILLFFIVIFKKYYLALHREIYIRSFTLPEGMIERMRMHHPELNSRDFELMHLALRQFFTAYLRCDFKSVGMPSVLIGILWREFSCYTKSYQRFCENAFGHVLPYTPVSVLSDHKEANIALRRCWQYVCHEEGIDPYSPQALPLLFEIDGLCQVKNRIHYLIDDATTQQPYDATSKMFYVSDFLSTSFDGSVDGLDDHQQEQNSKKRWTLVNSF